MLHQLAESGRRFEKVGLIGNFFLRNELVKTIFAGDEVAGDGDRLANGVAEAHDDFFNLDLRFFYPLGNLHFLFAGEEGD